MTMVGQEPFLLDGTIRENLDITGCKSDDDVWAAIESAQVRSWFLGAKTVLTLPENSSSQPYPN